MMKIFFALTVLALANASQYRQYNLCDIECRNLETRLQINLDNVAWVCSWLDIANPISWNYISGFICDSQDPKEKKMCKDKCGFVNKIEVN